MALHNGIPETLKEALSVAEGFCIIGLHLLFMTKFVPSKLQGGNLI